MFDFGITDKGELIFDAQNKDINKNTQDGLRRQIALCRLKSIVGDWFNTNIGANLEEHLGKICNNEIANEVMESIETSLTYDNFISKTDLFFVPQIEANTISVLVFINSIISGPPSVINVIIDIVGGVKIHYDPYK